MNSSTPSRFRRVMLAPWLAFRSLPVLLQLMIVVLSLAVMGIGGTIYIRERKAENRQIQVSQHWRYFEECAGRLDTLGMEKTLAGLQFLSPNDPLLQRRLLAMQSGDQVQDDPILQAYWMNQHLRQGNLVAAVKIAEERLKTVEKDWQALCILIQLDLQQNRIASAQSRFALLPNPFQYQPTLGPGSILFAIQLGQQLSANVDTLRQYRTERIAPVLKHPLAKQLLLPERLQLLECYQQSLLQDLSISPSLLTFWEPAIELFRQSLEELSWQETLANSYARWGQSQFWTLQELTQRGNISSKQSEVLREDLLQLLQKAWSEIRRANPKEAGSYRGLASVAWFQGDWQTARKLLETGIAECGPVRELRIGLARVLAKENPTEALKLLEESIPNGTTELSDLQLLMETAVAAGRLDRAKFALQQARQKDPKADWPNRWLARISFAQGDFASATIALDAMAKQQYLDPEIAKLKVLALLSSKPELLQPYLQELMQPQHPLPTQTVALGAALQLGKADVILQHVEELNRRYPADTSVWELLAFSLAALAQESSGKWNEMLARRAVNAFEWLLEKQPNNHNYISRCAMLQLQAIQSPEAALQTCMRLMDAEKLGKLAPEHVETLAVVLIANRRLEDGRRLLEKLVRQYGTVSNWLELAKLYQTLQLTNEAKRCLEQAGTLPRTDAQTQELKKLFQSLQGT